MTVLIEDGMVAFPVEQPANAETFAAAPGKLTAQDMRAYGWAAFGPGLLYTPMLLYVPQLYAKNFGISLAALGAALVALRIINAFTDQVIGFISDRTRTRWGARKPWILFGAGLTVFASFFLLRPPPMATLFYLIAWKLVYDLAYTVTDINFTAWGADLSSDYDTRSRINGMRGFVYQIANLGNYLLPIATAWLGLTRTSAYTLGTLNYFFIVAAVIIPLTTAYSLLKAPAGRPLPVERPDLAGFFRSVRHNRPLWLYLASFMLTGVGQGMSQIMFTFYDGYLRLGAWYPYLMSVFALVLVAAVPMWATLAQRLGKHRAFVLSAIVSSLSMQGFWLIDPATMSTQLVVGISFVIVILLGSSAGALIVISPAILADVADFGRFKTGEQRTGSYYAFYMLTSKIAMAIGAGIAFMLLSAFGYNARAGAVNTGMAAFGILFTVALLPGVLKCAAAAMIWKFPIDRRAHAIIERRLAQRDARAGTT
jgi:Na+/melibiose symporter-like transporter